MINPLLGKRYLHNFLPCVVLIIISFWLFRYHVSGDYTFFGNPDRLNHSLKMLKFYVDGISTSGLQAWNEGEMLGFDTFAQPYTFPNPFSYLVTAFGAENIYVTAGFVSLALLASSGVAAYAFMRKIGVTVSSSLASAILYQCSALSILKVSQNDMSFAVLVLIPLMALVVRHASNATLASSYLYLSILTAFLLQFCFIQKAAYAVLFIGLYIIFRAWQEKNRMIFFILALAGLTGAIGASGRLYGLFETMASSSRIQPGEKIDTFADLFRYQNIQPNQIFRWFEDGIFGRFLSDGATQLNGINLTEGFLLYTSVAVPFLVVAALTQLGGRWNGSLIGRSNESRFFIWFVLFTFAVTLLEPFNYLIHILFFKIDFVHARILVVGLLPLVTYVALRLDSLRPLGVELKLREIAVGIAIGGALIFAIELAVTLTDGSWPVSAMQHLLKRPETMSMVLSKPAFARLILSGAVSIILLFLISRINMSGCPQGWAYPALCVFLPLQAFISADFRLNGTHTRDENVPFSNGDFYFSKRSDFQTQSKDTQSELQRLVEKDYYRSVVVCDPKTAGGFCASHLSQYWKLRLADGYYGSGVPSRIAMLPWSAGLGLRHIVFTSEQQLPWPLLGLLNVKYALISNSFLYEGRLKNDLQWPRLIANPAKVVPRAFFTEVISPARSAEEARDVMFGSFGDFDPLVKSVVEGLEETQHFGVTGKPIIESSADLVTVSMVGAKFDRFLVINELYNSRWVAEIEGKATKIYPTNVVMRGIVVPAGVSRVIFHYVPAARSNLALWFQACFFIVLIAGFLIAKRISLIKANSRLSKHENNY